MTDASLFAEVGVFGRRGARPCTLPEMRNLYLDEKGEPWLVEDDPRP